ncbi:DUF421 domain-containing protein [Clostridium formicaceticum]|uniref:DUF421 domain-containing protein n=1 Tax=Clostridium formicaceticum TaxID=1497 RepID=A0AAC9RRB6_9CLOT|nr:DUF421 domain-containing protein [Clostridium formicaceticum]AOY75204.1 DUF421 domain-containing protein [Clostridium formicaceticum]ARE89635.1 hypothetical protein CLFO_41160 [Clostridium formicaceticum]
MKDYILILGRIMTILPLLLFATVFIMGRRPIGELPVLDFLIIITMGSVVGADIADPSIEHLPTAFAVVVLALLQSLISRLILKNRKFSRLISFEPTLIIENGRFIVKNMRKIKYSIDEVLMMLREKDIFHFNEVHYAIVESNGKLTVLKKSNLLPLKPKDMDITTEEEEIPAVVILEGKLDKKSLEKAKISEENVVFLAKKQGYRKVKDIFLATYSNKEGLLISPYKVEASINIEH